MANTMKTAALRELIAAELAAEQPGRDSAATQARLAHATTAYNRAVRSSNARWDRALGRRRRPSPASTD